MLIHPIKPLYNNEAEILILGSFPSVKSREEGLSMVILKTDSGKLWQESVMKASLLQLKKKRI